MKAHVSMEEDVNKDKKKQRGIFLNIMIFLLIAGDLQIPYYLLNPEALRTVYSSIPSWYPIYAVLGLISNIAIIIGIWRMKKMGNLRIGCLFCLQNTGRFGLYLARYTASSICYDCHRSRFMVLGYLPKAKSI